MCLQCFHQGAAAADVCLTPDSCSLLQGEAEKLQRLKERVETQEAKLKKIRAMRGQVDYSKLINGNLSRFFTQSHKHETFNLQLFS